VYTGVDNHWASPVVLHLFILAEDCGKNTKTIYIYSILSNSTSFSTEEFATSLRETMYLTNYYNFVAICH
jgi:hypothetical protein